jgi:dCTP deaminase
VTGVSRATTERHLPEAEVEQAAGVLPLQDLRDAVLKNWIVSEYVTPRDALQPASVDLTLGQTAFALRCSFLPDPKSTVAERARDLTLYEVDLRGGGGTLERDRPYLIPLVEELRLPSDIRAKANPKSSTGRLDVFTRVISDRNGRFDEIAPAYKGKLYLEVVPRSFTIKVRHRLALNQLRLIAGDARVDDSDLRKLQQEFPLLYLDKHPLPEKELQISDGLFLSVDLREGPDPDRIVGYRAKRNSLPIDLSKVHTYRWQDYWEPVRPERGSRIVLDPEVFYLLLSAEGVCIPPEYAAEMMAYDPTAGELRTHYAGFFDPGFGFDARHEKHGSRAALEVRARDVPFMVEHRQPLCKLAFENMAARPERLYGEEVGSNYQGQVTMLSKHFIDQTAGITQMTLREQEPPLDPTARPAP